MDQPKQDDDVVQNDAQWDAPEQNETPEVTQISVENMDSSNEQSGSSDELLEGVPGVGESENPTDETPTPTEDLLAEAEEQVVEAEPQSTEDELAVVASELEEASHALPTNSDDNSGSDPMEQIVANETNETQDTPLEDNEPHMTVDETADEGGTEPAPESSESTPVSDVSSEENSPEASPEPTPESNNDTESEPSFPEQTPQEDSTAGLVGLESEAPSQADEDSAPTSEPATSATNPGVINDVIAPSAVAAAAAAGTAGENAITQTPEASSVESAQSQASVTMQQHGAKKSGGPLKIIILVVLVTLLFGGGAIAAYMMNPSTTEDTTSEEATKEPASEEPAEEPAEEPSDEETAAPGEKVEASSLNDYKATCSPGGLVTNATAYGGPAPHPVVVFEKGGDDKYALSLVSFKDQSWTPAATDFGDGQLVACVSRKLASETKLKDCPITDATTKVTTNVPFYSTTYTVDVYEALTGKKVTTFENKSISTTCPTNAIYDRSDPKIYAVYDQVALETSLTESVTKKF